MKSYNSFDVAQEQIIQAAKLLNLDEPTKELLLWPQREFKFTLPVRMDNGEVKIFHAYRIQYNYARGPAKGGIRFHPNETVDIIRALACWACWKSAVVDLPLGGGKGGIVCNPKNMSERELEGLSRAYIRAAAQYIGIDKDVPAPDVYTNPQIMAWMMDEYESIVNKHQPGVITDKPIQLGGTEGKRDSVSHGGVITVREACKRLGVDPKKFAIQGFGNAGQRAALLHQELLGTGKLVAASDSGGAVYNPDGLDPRELVMHKLKTGSVKGFSGGKEYPREGILELDLDVLYPAALENSITAENADNIKAKIICELSNGPTTPEADLILNKKGIHIIPDILASAGGVTASYFEMVQDSYSFYWDEKLVHQRLDDKMTKSYNAIYEAEKDKKVHPRLAAMVVGVARVSEACKLRGWV